MMKKRETVGIFLVVLMIVLAGCGQKEEATANKESAETVAENVVETVSQETEILIDTEGLKEFTSKDGTNSIMFFEEWKEYEELKAELPNARIAVQSADGEVIAGVLQHSKREFKNIYSSVEELLDNYLEGMNASDVEAVSGITIPNLENVEAVTCTLGDASYETKAYFVCGETEYAYYIISLVKEGMKESDRVEYNRCLVTFKENQEAIAELEAKIEAEWEGMDSDTVAFINAMMAIHIRMSGLDLTCFGGLELGDNSTLYARQFLEEVWEITDKETAEDVIIGWMADGASAELMQILQLLEEEGFGEMSLEERESYLLDHIGIPEAAAEPILKSYEPYEEGGLDMIKAWDFSQAIIVASMAYHAGYYTKEEALSISWLAAGTAQHRYGSWDELMESYFMGYQFWEMESSEERRKIYEELKKLEESPYITWDTPLEMFWKE